MAEPAAHNGLVGGSTPSALTNLWREQVSPLDYLIKACRDALSNMTAEAREAMYREQCRPRNPFDGRTDEELVIELGIVREKMRHQSSWGAASGALIEWEKELKCELRAREART